MFSGIAESPPPSLGGLASAVGTVVVVVVAEGVGVGVGVGVELHPVMPTAIDEAKTNEPKTRGPVLILGQRCPLREV